jgi:transcription-repair coupling factor (superfamily II helicase)
MKTSLLLGAKEHQEILEFLFTEGALTISGVSNETAKALLLAHFLSLHCRRTIIVVPDRRRSEALRKWLEFFEAPPSCFLSPLHTLLQLREGTGGLLLLLAREQWEQSCPLLGDIARRVVVLRQGKRIRFTELIEALTAGGYQHCPMGELPLGTFRRERETFLVFPPHLSSPVRVSCAFDVIESIVHGGNEHIPTLLLYPLLGERHVPLSKQAAGEFLLVLDDLEDGEFYEHSPTLRFAAFPETEKRRVHLRYLSVLKFYTLPDFLNDLKDKLHQQWRLIIATKRPQELCGILREEGISFVLAGEGQGGGVGGGRLTVLPVGESVPLPHSMQNPDLHLALITDREIFSLRRSDRHRTMQKLALDFLTSLQVGDYIVHTDQGIGHFAGIVQKEMGGLSREYLELHYAEGDKLFVPVDQADRLSKFVHEEGEEPVLSRLGSVEWKRTARRVKEETRKIAKELLEFYARRAKTKGHAYSPDTESQRSFEDAFLYDETPGQLAALQEIKKDMESPRPTDRLICGDVGFGKTEVALRAAFKTVQDGRQVAFISPITILADQHYRTARERFKGFSRPSGKPIVVDVLSRFRSASEQRSVLRKLQAGEIDIVVGTHRLLQSDVKFKNLGLLVVDEEQRFGVRQKERLKEMRLSVDVITLTATPVPRTMNFALYRLRDISTITTPPPGRLPIITEVRRYSDSIVRQAILTELKRKGQVYMLHNRVQTIEAFREHLEKLVPEATFVVTHGQMRSALLEDHILQFKDGRYDVLVSSTIIENGIDLPNANTLVVNEAEHFGLAQLYQLRGRVGRGSMQAYAYFLYRGGKLQDDAKKRLRAIVEASELGSGFQIAIRDLEIRGAGEILGVEQSGHIHTVGVSHFLRLLQQTIAELKGEKVTAEEGLLDTEINLPIEALIPSYYILEEEEKIASYQRLASCTEESTLRDVEEDLRHSYGPLPKQVRNLLYVLGLKLACREAGVSRVKAEQANGDLDIVLTLAPSVTAEHLAHLLSSDHGWRVSENTLRACQTALGGRWTEVLLKDVKSMVEARRRRRRKEGARRKRGV